jgi:hypothetical protein
VFFFLDFSSLFVSFLSFSNSLSLSLSLSHALTVADRASDRSFRTQISQDHGLGDLNGCIVAKLSVRSFPLSSMYVIRQRSHCVTVVLCELDLGSVRNAELIRELAAATQRIEQLERESETQCLQQGQVFECVCHSRVSTFFLYSALSSDGCCSEQAGVNVFCCGDGLSFFFLTCSSNAHKRN